jgi:hypothetical protein
MFGLLAAAVLLPQDVTIFPTDDIWVYPHASDPQKDPFLRVWGAEGKAVPGKDEDGAAFSVSYLKFQLKDFPAGARLTGATLTLTHAAGAAYEEKTARENPVEVRWLSGDFAEKGWSYDMFDKLRPSDDKNAVLGAAFPEKWPKELDFTITIDLAKNAKAWEEAWKSAQAAGVLRLALSSTIDPSVEGRSAIYKFYSKDGKEGTKPTLKLSFEK